MRSLVTHLFPAIKLGAEINSWRYTLTLDEPLHFDEYAGRVTKRVIRVFVNLDIAPRVWDVGPIATDKDRGTYDPVYKARISKGPSERIEFAPGQMWLIDSRRVAHAIIYGRRAAMFSFEIDGQKA
jgi:hypothetical protein